MDPDLQSQRGGHENSSTGLSERWPSQGSITIHRVYAKYNTTDVQDTYCLQDIDLSIHPGQKVSICGRTGSGKTSLLLALLHILPLHSGSIIIDGIDISTLSPDQLQERFIGVPQQSFIMPNSVRRNLDPTGKLPDDVLLTALAKVTLRGVVELLGGLDAVLDQTSLSQGQQQLFCLARALCRKRDGDAVVVLDEATSNLDETSHGLISELLASEFRECTVITIAHRVSVVLELGK
jgi:ABC-type multidrug transport system fused ATPase/permease subunit